MRALSHPYSAIAPSYAGRMMASASAIAPRLRRLRVSLDPDARV